MVKLSTQIVFVQDLFSTSQLPADAADMYHSLSLCENNNENPIFICIAPFIQGMQLKILQLPKGPTMLLAIS